MNNEAHCRTAPATPGLLIKYLYGKFPGFIFRYIFAHHSTISWDLVIFFTNTKRLWLNFVMLASILFSFHLWTLLLPPLGCKFQKCKHQFKHTKCTKVQSTHQGFWSQRKTFTISNKTITRYDTREEKKNHFCEPEVS